MNRQNYSWLRFFNKSGEDLNFEYNEAEDKWEGTVYLDRVSTGLIEYEPVYILQEVWDEVSNTSLGLRKPKKLNLTPWCPGATSTNILAKWLDETPGTTLDNVEQIFLWEFEGYPGPDPYITKVDELDIDLGDFTGDLVGPSGGGGTGQPVYTASSTTPFEDEVLSIRVGLQSNEEDSYTRTLQLIDPNYLDETSYSTFGCTGSSHVFCEIRYYGETEGEDERLETLIENLGSTIKDSDSKIFDDVDINEALPDWIKLNSKRKELLLEFDNIFPFTGSYKALINILKYFGYDQVTLKEYWLNIDELKGNNPEGVSRLKYKQTPIEDLFSDNPSTSNTSTNLIPSKLYKKTSKFGLFYDITRDSGEFDEDGLPIVEEAFLFSNEEVLIKLFALKQKLKNYFLPLNARIVDIVGEAVFYSLYDINIWSDLLRVDDVELNINPCVNIYPEDGCSLIEDLSPRNFKGVKIPPNLNISGVTPFVSYAIGVTQTGSLGSGDYSGVNEKYIFTDTVSGATIQYVTPEVGLTSGQILDGIIETWNSQTVEPWTNFELTKESGQDPSVYSFPVGYQWLYAVQTNIIGPTSGSNFVLGATAIPGPTSAIYTIPGVTSLSYSFGSSALSFYSSTFLGFFDGYDRDITEAPDYPCAPIAAPFVLENCSFDINWNEAVVNWQSLDLYDWETIGYENFFELEWIITYEGDIDYVVESGLLGIEEGKQFPILLPYIGNYTVDLKLYDSFGSVSRWYKKSALCVDSKAIDFIGHYRFRECDYTWDSKTIERQSEQTPPPSKATYPFWDVYNSTWDLPLQENEEFRMQDLTYNELDRIEFYQTQNDPQYQGFCDDVPPVIPGATTSRGLYDLDSYYWNLIEGNATWDDICHLWWDGIGPKIVQSRIDYPTLTGVTNPTFVFAKQPIPLNLERQFSVVSDTADLLGLTGPAYKDVVKVISTNEVYQYLGGPTGSTGGSSWVEKAYEIDYIELVDIDKGGTLLGNDPWKEAVRQINQALQDNPQAYTILNDFIIYYNEEYEDPTNPLRPQIQFVSKEPSLRNKYYIRIQNDVSGYPSLSITFDGATYSYVTPYETVNFGDMGDIPFYFEIFATGPSGGILYLPGTTTYVDTFGATVTGTTLWPYDIGCTSLVDLHTQLTYLSQALAPTGPSAGASAISIDGPITNYEWNIVYGASGYTGSTTSFPPPSSLAAIKIQGAPKYFSSNDYDCVKFEASGATGSTSTVLGGTSGFAGTMCGRSIVANSTWDTLRIHKYANEFPLLTQIQFNYSISPMVGKQKVKWTLIRENDPNWVNIYYNNPYFSYMFTREGSYTLELEITDNQGNTKVKTKKEFVKII